MSRTQLMIDRFVEKAKPGYRMMVVCANAAGADHCRRAFLAIPGTYEIDNYIILKGATIDFVVPEYRPEPPSGSIILDDPFGD